MYGHDIYSSKSMDQPCKVANPARGQLNKEKLVSRDKFGRPVPRHPDHLHTQAESTCSRDSSRLSRWRLFIYFSRHTPSGQSRVCRVTQVRTNDVHCRESAGTVPIFFKVAPVTGAAFSSITMDQLMCASLLGFLNIIRRIPSQSKFRMHEPFGDAQLRVGGFMLDSGRDH